ncbi:nucleoside-diphosphate-sugar epimerase [Sphingobium xenophagum]|uniref:Nucleoside-diphosphate-sugar epimerase n=1 Tax=Sphingobium xenophagum TaxID=121428 RepID=A0ABU1X623_SPHXE|nr:NAD(P)-dependent oxidoreductase [Sphingobium xenophagum]MDR7156497.1 nucleoside-diphosphate-sugar epimerase [Sphingobium xenophagum]
MLKNEKILVTGATGTLGSMVGRALAKENEVWGLARYADPLTIERSQRDGIRPLAVDMALPDFASTPQDFTCLLHFAHTRLGADAFPEAVRVNAVGPGLLMQHCRKLKATLVVSSTAVYTPQADIWHPLAEGDPIGGAFAPWAPTSPASKLSLEATSKLAAEAFGIPTVIARLNTTYGPGRGAKGGMPVMDMETVLRGDPVRTFADPYPHSPIHFEDIVEQIEALLSAASAPATLINWCGDEVVTQREWCEMVGSFAGVTPDLQVQPLAGAPCGNVGDNRQRLALTGPCKRRFSSAYRELYDALITGAARV